jgi:hypothetical protein
MEGGGAIDGRRREEREMPEAGRGPMGGRRRDEREAMAAAASWVSGGECEIPE